MSKLSVHLVAWNSTKYISYIFESLRAQTFKDWELLVIDNNSQDGSADLVEKELEDFPVFARLIKNKENLGFAKGHNQAVQASSSEYFQLYNQDIYLAPDYLEKVVQMMDNNPDAGAGQGLLLRWDFSNQNKTDVIDTLGLKVLRNRRVVDYKTGEIHKGSTSVNEVFGISGALPMYRHEAVEQAMFEGQMFDEDFFMYKEDVDLAFRLRSQGWKAYTAPGAKAWHDRTAAGPKEMSDKAALENRASKPAFINYHSYKNHLMVLLKNEHCANLSKDWFWIFWYEFKKLMYLMFTDWKTLKSLAEIKKLWPRLMKKRKQVMRDYKIKPDQLRKWYV